MRGGHRVSEDTPRARQQVPCAHTVGPTDAAPLQLPCALTVCSHGRDVQLQRQCVGNHGAIRESSTSEVTIQSDILNAEGESRDIIQSYYHSPDHHGVDSSLVRHFKQTVREKPYTPRSKLLCCNGSIVTCTCHLLITYHHRAQGM